MKEQEPITPPFTLNPIQRLDLYRHIQSVLQKSIDKGDKLYTGGLCYLINEALFEESPVQNPNYKWQYVYDEMLYNNREGMDFLPELLAQRPQDYNMYWFPVYDNEGNDIGSQLRFDALERAIKLVPIL